jgi:hypothetical protein
MMVARLIFVLEVLGSNLDQVTYILAEASRDFSELLNLNSGIVT